MYIMYSESCYLQVEVGSKVMKQWRPTLNGCHVQCWIRCFLKMQTDPCFVFPPLPADEFPADGDAFEPPGAAVESGGGGGGRQWSSLKGSTSLPAPREEDRERAKSLPAYGSTNHNSSHQINHFCLR